jgi:hypothetical protein
MTRSSWRWWHVLVVAAGAVAMFLLVTAVLAEVLLLRVLADLGPDRPQPDDAQVVAARDAAASRLTADADRLTAAVVIPALGPAAQRVGRGQVEPPCAVGQHNWKIDDDFDLACDLSRVEVVAAPRRETFTADMQALDEALRAEGWTPSPVGTMAEELQDFEGDVLALSGSSYTRTVAGSERTLAIRWTAYGASPDSVSYYADDPEHAELRTAGGERAHVSYLLEAIPPDGYAVVATEGVEYFRQ